MRSSSCRRSYQWGVFLLLLLASGSAVSSSSATQTIKDWEWTDKNWKIVVNELLPMKGKPGYYVTYRATQSLHGPDEKPEYYFRLGFDRSDQTPGLNDYVSAHVRTTDSVSIYAQIMDMHRKNPTRSWQNIRASITLKSLDFTEMECPAVRKEFRDFQDLRYGPPYTNPDQMEFMVDPAVFEFHVDATTGQADITLYEHTHPLVVWAMKTQRELEACASEKVKQKPGH
jgi:hypothetical protein